MINSGNKEPVLRQSAVANSGNTEHALRESAVICGNHLRQHSAANAIQRERNTA